MEDIGRAEAVALQQVSRRVVVESSQLKVDLKSGLGGVCSGLESGVKRVWQMAHGLGAYAAIAWVGNHSALFSHESRPEQSFRLHLESDGRFMSNTCIVSSPSSPCTPPGLFSEPTFDDDDDLN